MKKLLLILFVSLAVSLPAHAKKGGKDGGYGAGGQRDDFASETGMEQGKAWAGSKEKYDAEMKDKDKDKDKKQKKEKKQKQKQKNK